MCVCVQVNICMGTHMCRWACPCVYMCIEEWSWWCFLHCSLFIKAWFLLGPEAHQLALGISHYCLPCVEITMSAQLLCRYWESIHSLHLWDKYFIHWTISSASDPIVFSPCTFHGLLQYHASESTALWRLLEAPDGYNHYKRLLSSWDLELALAFILKNSFWNVPSYQAIAVTL